MRLKPIVEDKDKDKESVEAGGGGKGGKRTPREELIVTDREKPTGNVSPKLSHRVRVLDKWMQCRPTWSEDAEEKNKKREIEITENINEVQIHETSA